MVAKQNLLPAGKIWLTFCTETLMKTRGTFHLILRLGFVKRVTSVGGNGGCKKGLRERQLWGSSGLKKKDVCDRCLLWQLCTCDLKEKQLGDRHKPSSQRPWRTRAPFQRHSWEENHSIQIGIPSVNYSWTKMLKTSSSGIQAFKRQRKPRGKWSGAVFVAKNICILSGVQMMRWSREPRVRAGLIPHMITRPFNWTTRFASRNQALIVPLCRSTLPTPLCFLLAPCNVFEERKE